MARERVRLVVLFGGRSAEHEVSCVSARHVLAAADQARYELVPVGITREGRWVDARDALGEVEQGAPALPSPDGAPPGAAVEPLSAVAGPGTVVVLPLVHGPMGEDGTVQGMLELAGIPYVGAGVLASALCMDKGAAKDVLTAHGLPQPRYRVLRDPDPASVDVADLGWPVFVKPANLGSSVGVTRCPGPAEVAAAVREAVRFDEYVIVEEAVAGREIEVAVLGNGEARASLPGEIVPSHDFYDFDDKYLDGAADLRVPAPLDEAATEAVRRLALRAYAALRVDGMARVDFFLEEPGRGFLVNELNTVPGFTPVSMYPKLWEATGLPYAALVDELVRLALDRHARRSRFETAR